MATLHALVEQRIGPVMRIDLLRSSLNEALANLVSVMPAHMARAYQSEISGPAGDGISFRGRLMGGAVNGRPAKLVPPERAEQVSAPGSIYTASALFPAIWSIRGRAFGFPEGPLKLYVSAPPEVTPSTQSIEGSPPGSEELAVLYACSQLLTSRIHFSEVPIAGEIPDPPESPDAPEITVTDATADLISETTIAALPALDPYDKPSHSPPAAPTITPLNLPEPPDADALDAPSFTFPEVAAPVIESVSLGDLPDPPSYQVPDQLTRITGAYSAGEVGDQADQNELLTWFSTLSQIIENQEDPELATQASQRIQRYVELVREAVTSAASEFNGEVAAFQARLTPIIEAARLAAQRASEQAQLTAQAELANAQQTTATEIQQYASTLEHYSARLSAWQAQIGATVQLWQANELESKINYYFSEYRNSLELFASQQQAELSSWQAQLSTYQAEVGRVLEQARLDAARAQAAAQMATQVSLANQATALSGQVQAWQGVLGHHQTVMARYAAQVQKVLTRFETDRTAWNDLLTRDRSLAGEYYQRYHDKLTTIIAHYDSTANDRAGARPEPR